MDYQSLLPELTLDEKVTLLSGRDFSTAAGVDRLNIPPITVRILLELHFGSLQIVGCRQC